MVMVFEKYETDPAGRTFVAPYNVEEFSERRCGDCEGKVVGEGVFATGASLPRGEGVPDYEPFEGELLKNLWAECACGWNQYS